MPGARPRQGKGAPGHAQLYINEKLVGQANIPVTIPLALGIGEELAVGRDRNAPFPAAVLAPPDTNQAGKGFRLATCENRVKSPSSVRIRASRLSS